MPKLPDTPGLEAAGVIEAVGDGVIGLRVGMRLAAFAGKTYAEYCLAPVTQVVSLPDGVSFTDGAAFLIQGLTAYHLLHTADATGPGRTVLVHSAAGGVGILAVQLARTAGARVLAPVSSDAKAALVKENGAAAVINDAREKRRLPDGVEDQVDTAVVREPPPFVGERCFQLRRAGRRRLHRQDLSAVPGHPCAPLHPIATVERQADHP